MYPTVEQAKQAAEQQLNTNTWRYHAYIYGVGGVFGIVWRDILKPMVPPGARILWHGEVFYHADHTPYLVWTAHTLRSSKEMFKDVD